METIGIEQYGGSRFLVNISTQAIKRILEF